MRVCVPRRRPAPPHCAAMAAATPGNVFVYDDNGTRRKTGGGTSGPQLLEWVAAKASRKGSIMKEESKLREERELAREKG